MIIMQKFVYRDEPIANLMSPAIMEVPSGIKNSPHLKLLRIIARYELYEPLLFVL